MFWGILASTLEEEGVIEISTSDFWMGSLTGLS